MLYDIRDAATIVPAAKTGLDEMTAHIECARMNAEGPRTYVVMSQAQLLDLSPVVSSTEAAAILGAQE